MNPELRKYGWMEFSRHRLLATPIFIAMATILLVVMADGEQSLPESLTFLFLLGFWSFAGIGGAYATATAVTREFNAKTWDWVRLGQLSAWQTSWGIILGASSFMWYGALWCVSGVLAVPVVFDGYAFTASHWKLLLLGVEMALLFQAVGFLGAFAVCSQSQQQHKPARNFGTLAAFLALFMLNPLLFIEDQPRVTWHELELGYLEFLVFTMAAFAGWSWLGAYRVVRGQLQGDNSSLYWMIFTVFLVLYCSGFAVDAGDSWNEPLYLNQASLIFSLAWFYLVLFSYPPTGRNLHALLVYGQNRNWLKLEQSLPLWLTPLLMGLLLGLSLFANHKSDTVMMGLGFCFLACRDASLLVAFTCGKHPSRAVPTTLVYLVFLYAVFPLMLTELGPSDADMPGLLLTLLIPADHALSALVLLSEALLVGGWAFYRVHGTRGRH